MSQYAHQKRAKSFLNGLCARRYIGLEDAESTGQEGNDDLMVHALLRGFLSVVDNIPPVAELLRLGLCFISPSQNLSYFMSVAIGINSFKV